SLMPYPLGAKYKAIKHEPMTDAESLTWSRIQELIGRFQRANRTVVGVPMWNFSVPHKLKQSIDLTAQRNYLFTYDGKECGPSLNIPKALAVYTRDLHIVRVLQYHQASITRRLTLIFGFA